MDNRCDIRSPTSPTTFRMRLCPWQQQLIVWYGIIWYGRGLWRIAGGRSVRKGTVSRGRHCGQAYVPHLSGNSIHQEVNRTQVARVDVWFYWLLYLFLFFLVARVGVRVCVCFYYGFIRVIITFLCGVFLRGHAQVYVLVFYICMLERRYTHDNSCSCKCTCRG